VLASCFDADCDSIVGLQRKVGVKYATDGQLTLAWQDIFRPISKGFDGLEPGPMVRWFNTNTFFFTPIVNGPVSSDGKVLLKAVEKKFVKNGQSEFKIIIPDPLTFAELADDRHYKNKEKLLFAYSDALNGELRALSSAGAKYVQFSAPSLVYRLKQKPFSRDDLKQLGEAIRAILKGVSARSGFYPPFGDAAPYLPELFDVIPTDDIGIDLTQTDESALVATKKGVIAGIVDSRTTYLEDAAALASRVEKVADKTETKTVTISPSADLRFIPRVSADEKLVLLGRVRNKIGRKPSKRKGSQVKGSSQRRSGRK
jgi:methionine synthase II (cobalamin-independent)